MRARSPAVVSGAGADTAAGERATLRTSRPHSTVDHLSKAHLLPLQLSGLEDRWLFTLCVR